MQQIDNSGVLAQLHHFFVVFFFQESMNPISSGNLIKMCDIEKWKGGGTRRVVREWGDLIWLVRKD